MRATRANIYLKNLENNISCIKDHLKQNSTDRKSPMICFAVKADAYGHGAVEISKTALKNGIEFLSVASVEEAIELRENCIDAPILLLSLAMNDEVEDIIKYKIIPLVSDIEYIDYLNSKAGDMNKKLTVHIKIDTGMGRIGCTPEDTLKLAEKVKICRFLTLGGICTHLPASDRKNRKFTLTEIARFKNAVEKVKASGIDPGIIHCANSGAILDYPESYFDMVRPGIILYGYYPSKYQKKLSGIKPLMEFESRVVFIKKVEKGSPISYNMTYKTRKNTYIATIPAGYGDGYNRLLSNKGKVLINGKEYRIAGKVCMDQFMIDIGNDNNIKKNDRAVLFSTEGITAETIADLTGTISYEVCCNINKRVKRIYIN